ncbi:transposable element Tcb1 transposase [Trichonephila clavipes]|nr:transposable element Tcb1 transposase [Trichonephila clavipes]
MLGRRIAARPRPPATVRDLEIALLEEWNSIPQSLIDNLIASMANRAWQADWQQIILSDEPCFNLWDHDGHIRVRLYAGERCLPEYVIERYSGVKPEVMVWNANSYHRRYNFLRFEAQHIELLPWSADSPAMSPIGQVWGWLIVVSLLIRDLQLQKTNFCCAYKQFGVRFHKQTFKIGSSKPFG